MTCQYLCQTETLSPVYNDLTACMMRNNCIGPHIDHDTPDNFCSRLDSLPTVSYTMEAIMSKWWVNYGLNIALDCVPCQYFSFVPDPLDSSKVTVEQGFRSFKNRIWNLINMTARPSADDLQRGVLPNNYTQAGFSAIDSWYILGVQGDEMLAVYCQPFPWQTHGVFLMSRAPGRCMQHTDHWRSVLERSGIHWKNVCRADVVSDDCTRSIQSASPEAVAIHV
eukprot:CAMPEP_0175411584 /NCGR_PEP_ID=MMETSP0095-20121207/42197_1 /TAXON_ID=311494 /ORGANISM="Alexandrium monilatum, Strain CCMP3105" /LENGTH=222 /DNA_ID=CAMNT_0016710565 /DNA_START=184 /DNA_END=852 /DNA_ORIENTATION=-